MKHFFQKTSVCALAMVALLGSCGQKQQKEEAVAMSGNPVFEGWYADPEGVIYGDTYWIYPTCSEKYEKQTFLNCFSSKDLVNWTKHEAIIDTTEVKWAKKCMWAPAVISKDGKYYLFFSANDVHEGEIGGIGVAVADRPKVRTRICWENRSSTILSTVHSRSISSSITTMAPTICIMVAGNIATW